MCLLAAQGGAGNIWCQDPAYLTAVGEFSVTTWSREYTMQHLWKVGADTAVYGGRLCITEDTSCGVMPYLCVCMKLVLDLSECGHKRCRQALHHSVLRLPCKLVFIGQFGISPQIFWKGWVSFGTGPS